MKGGGYYSQSTRGAKDVIDKCGGMLIEAVAALPEPASGEPVRIADFGAADGGTSKETIRNTIAAIRHAIASGVQLAHRWQRHCRSLVGVGGTTSSSVALQTVSSVQFPLTTS